jgi:hypothetical protein
MANLGTASLPRYTAVVTDPANKPLAALTQFAAALGWQGLRLNQHSWLDGDNPVITTWYESGTAEGTRSDLFLQVNEAPSGQTLTYVGAVYAMRYRICSGWHPFTLLPNAQLAVEASKVEAWLHRRWFETLAMRRDFRRLHPECTNYSWSRIQKQGPPYSQG